MWVLKSEIRPKAWSDCHMYYNVKETLSRTYIMPSEEGKKARKNPLHKTNRLRGFKPPIHVFQLGFYSFDVRPQMIRFTINKYKIWTIIISNINLYNITYIEVGFRIAWFEFSDGTNFFPGWKAEIIIKNKVTALLFITK